MPPAGRFESAWPCFRHRGTPPLRTQPEDYGIDAHAEVVDGEDMRGRLLALQIKSGNSWFREAAAEG